MEEHDVRPAPWRTPAAELHRELLGLGTVARLDRLQAALDEARRAGAAEALEALATSCERQRDEGRNLGLISPEALRRRAGLYLAGSL